MASSHDEPTTTNPSAVQRTYALIEADRHELAHIIDLFRQFFPGTRIVECKRENSIETVSSQQTSNSSMECDTPSDVSPCPVFRGKVKDYLQRRYLTEDHPSRFSVQATTNSNLHLRRLHSKRGVLQREKMIDRDDETSSNEDIQSSSDLPPSRDSHRFFFPSFDSEQNLSPTGNRLSLPVTPYSAASDPGPYQSPLTGGLVSFQFGHHRSLADESQLAVEEQVSSASLSVPPCQICQEHFDSPQTYLAHYRTHLEESPAVDEDTSTSDARPYSCSICSKRFSRSDMLNRHLRLHSGLRPYRCPICNTQFSRSDHLSSHFRTHTGEKPYLCPHCPYTACRRDMITRHAKTHRRQLKSSDSASFASIDES